MPNKPMTKDEQLEWAQMSYLKFKYLSNKLMEELQKRGMTEQELLELSGDIMDDFGYKFGLEQFS